MNIFLELPNYTVSDGNGGFDTATVTITVTNIQDAPVADDDTFTVAEDSTDNPLNVLAGDTDVDGDTLTVDAVGNPPNGTAVDKDTDILYTPDPDFFGSDTFTYIVSDGNGGTDTVTVTVTGSQDAPVADAGGDQFVDAGLVVTLNGTGSYDPDGSPLTYLWEQTGGDAVTLSNAMVVTPTFTTAVTHTVLTFTLTVSNGISIDTNEVVIVVTSHQLYLPLVLQDYSQVVQRTDTPARFAPQAK